MKHKPLPVLRSIPIIEKLELPPRAEILPQIESGQLDHIDFRARVFRTDTKIRNPYKFQDQDLPTFAASFEGQPFLRNHDTHDIDARDGTIIDSAQDGATFLQTIRLTTRRGMLDFVEGKIDRFSIGWFYDDVLCSICNESWFSTTCSHMPGRSYKVGESKQEKRCELIFVNPKGKETSAVNTPAVDGTGIEQLQELQEYKLSLAEAVPKSEVTGGRDRRDPHVENPGALRRGADPGRNSTKGFEASGEDPAHRAPRVSKPLLKGVNIMDPEDTNTPAKAAGATPATPAGPTESTDEIITESTDEASAALDRQLAQMEANRQATARLLGEHERMDQLQQQLDQSNRVLVAQCEYLLNSGLATSRLPDVVQKRIRKQFTGRAFQANELTTAIAEAREELAQLNDAANIQGPARNGSGFSNMFNGLEQFKAAVSDLLGAERDPELANLKVRPLRGIQEAYLLATGDVSFMGGYYPEFAHVTANFPGIVANVMNKMLIKAWSDFEQHYGWWRKIVTIEHFTNLNDATWLRTGTIASLPTVAERADYTELPIGDNKETSSWTKYGGYIPLTIEAVLRDDIRAFKRLPREAALGGIRNISEQVAAVFTADSGAGPTLADTGKLFNATVVTTAGGHANLLTTALGTDYTAWNAVALAVFNQPLLVKNADTFYGTGKKQAIDPSICLVPRALKSQADALFIPRWEATAQNVAPVSPSWGGRVEPLTVPEWTDANDWAAVVDPKLVPGIMLGEIFGEKPQIFSASSEIDPAMFANDESRIKVRQFLTIGVADFRALHKNNVT